MDKNIFGPEWTMRIRAVMLIIVYVCVYVKNYALVIVTQPKKEKLEIHFARKTQRSFLIQVYKTILSGSKQF